MSELALGIARVLQADRLKTRERLRRLLRQMRYDLAQPITDLHGKALHSEQLQTPAGAIEDPQSPPLTLGLVLFRAALFVEAGANPPAEEKFRQAQLAEKIVKGGSSVDLSTEEMARLRTQVGRMYMPTIVYRVWQMLDTHVGGADKIN